MTLLKHRQQINYTWLLDRLKNFVYFFFIVTKYSQPKKKTMITVDLALRAKQFEIARDDCKGKWMLKLGEMLAELAALRAAGNAIEDSGPDETWSEADIYGPTTSR